MSIRSKFVWVCLIGGTVGGGYVYREQAVPLAERYLGQYAYGPTAIAALKTGVAWIDYAMAQAKASSETPAPPVAKSASPPPAKGGRAGPPPAPVTVATAIAGDMPIILSAPGAVEPTATVAVRTRVDGQIVKVGFTEGDFVQKDQVLFELDDRLAKAQINQAEANVARDEANLKDAQAILARRDVLVRQKWTSEASADTQRATVESLKAGIAAGKALLEAQKTQLDYLVIRAPIAGRTGTVVTKLGSAVRAADVAAMVTVNQTRPITVAFALPQTELAAVRAALGRKATAKVTIPGTNPIAVDVQLAFVDNQVNQTTGTITAKAVAPNGDETLWPGQAVEVALTVEVVANVVSVPVSAVLPAAEGMIAWVIGADQKVQPRPVTLIRVVDQTAFLSDGVKSGEVVVTDGHGRIAPGFTVKVQMPVEPQAVPAGNSPAAAANPGPAKPGAPGPAPGARPAQAGEQRPGGGRKS